MTMIKRLIVTLVIALCAYTANAQTLYIYGGENHTVFLGKFNASPTDGDSIWNSFSEHGNKFNANCIWNQFGDYGNQFNSYCPWNQFSSDVPILVDIKGNSYGKFNSSNKNSIVRKVCKLASTIQGCTDLSLADWYEILFED